MALIDKFWGLFLQQWHADGWWLLVGFGAQALFMSRFIVQWIYSEKNRRSMIPMSFWWISIAGGLSLFAYAVHREELVFGLGQLLGLVVYVRNVFLVRKELRATPSS